MTSRASSVRKDFWCISVIIPAYQAEGYVAHAVRSAAKEAPKGTEILVVDDGSDDGTADAVDEFRQGIEGGSDAVHVRLIRHSNNRGKAAAINTGLEQARGSFIGVLDADDEYEAGGLRSLYEVAKEMGRDRVLVYGGFRVINTSGEVVGERRPPRVSDPERLRRQVAFAWRTPFHFNAALVGAPLYREAGPFAVEGERLVDIDMCLRILKRAETVGRVNESVYRYRKHRVKMMERVSVRLGSMQLRYRVLRRNFPGPAGLFGAAWMLTLDVFKLLYEIVGNYSS